MLDPLDGVGERPAAPLGDECRAGLTASATAAVAARAEDVKDALAGVLAEALLQLTFGYGEHLHDLVIGRQAGGEHDKSRDVVVTGREPGARHVTGRRGDVLPSTDCVRDNAAAEGAC